LPMSKIGAEPVRGLRGTSGLVNSPGGNHPER
jgi:hypothetical protein